MLLPTLFVSASWIWDCSSVSFGASTSPSTEKFGDVHPVSTRLIRHNAAVFSLFK